MMWIWFVIVWWRSSLLVESRSLVHQVPAKECAGNINASRFRLICAFDLHAIVGALEHLLSTGERVDAHENYSTEEQGQHDRKGFYRSFP